MSTEITRKIELAHGQKATWNAAKVREILAALSTSIPTSNVDWEEGDENWARLIRNGEVVVLICALAPIIFVLSKYSDTVDSVVDDCQIISVDSFSEQNLAVDKCLLEKLVGRELSDNVNYDKLSVDDLWWATI